jgi:serine/threonine protein kinase
LATELAPGVIIGGRYQLDHVLGQGGMGVVWAAVHTVTRRRVALKFLRGSTHLHPELRRRFLREARAASAVSHPNVLEVHDVFELDDQTPVMLMDLLEGETLGQRIARAGALSLPDAADILAQVVSGVGTAHTAGVVHRDLKPDNVFLVRVGDGPPSVRVLDFGIAKLVGAEGAAAETGVITGTGTMLGTPCYMSPEQSFGEKDIDYRTDIWSLGAILYECLTGARPVEGDSIGQVVKRLLSDGITPISVILPSLPADVTALVESMLRRERDQRPRDLRDVSKVLARYAHVKPPEFGPAAEEPAHVEEGDAEPRQIVVDSGDTDPSASTHHAPRSGPETAGAHTLSSPHSARRPARATWIVVGIVAIATGVGVAVVARTPSSASSASSMPQTASAPAVTPAAPVVDLRPVESSTPESVTVAPAPSVALPEPKTGDRTLKTLSHALILHHPPPASSAPPAAPAAVAPAPTPRPRQLGGLAEKPPF